MCLLTTAEICLCFLLGAEPTLVALNISSRRVWRADGLLWSRLYILVACEKRLRELSMSGAVHWKQSIEMCRLSLKLLEPTLPCYIALAMRLLECHPAAGTERFPIDATLAA